MTEKAPTHPDDIRCEYESRSFPADEFHDDPAHGVVHQVTPLHTTDGDLIDEDNHYEVRFPRAAP